MFDPRLTTVSRTSCTRWLFAHLLFLYLLVYPISSIRPGYDMRRSHSSRVYVGLMPSVTPETGLRDGYIALHIGLESSIAADVIFRFSC